MSNSTITVYSKPACVQCDATKKALVKAGLEFRVIDITEDADARTFAQGLGYMQAPVVVVMSDQRIDHWSGYKPDRIKALKDGGPYEAPESWTATESTEEKEPEE
ncbi:NrdH-redoxin [Rhodococcus sp. ACS1]|uniref:glutaredoxin domain-containing protein n=1 Tax=Rhodococcus sp. ACS1 TaxID=2028570 RepID=UPI000BB0EE2C|nr:glutaredoxin domain-containing protein [Rhodococcus sp. ACS1]PBC38521.1 NrdH-redoxin [Rhodococcus sp. ACS1]